jgi:protein tyrosine phosphatase (PTP) superfamily phosphohydrolase (DUF442 family)
MEREEAERMPWRRRRLSHCLIVLTLTACLGCQSHDAPQMAPRQVSADEPVFAPERVAPDPAGLHNVIRATPEILTGSEPQGDAAFASLKQLGVKAIVSVDGARPDVELARKYGLQYVHIPVGYDGVPKHAGESLAAAVRTIDGPIYVHCHHGKHRGPAAAAVACIAAGATDAAGARRLLELAGTGADYAGLWRDVENYQPPSQDAQLPALVETADVESLAAAMAQADRHFDNLKLCRGAGWKSPQDHPDLDPRQEALLVKEALREALRGLADGYDDQFHEWLRAAEALAGEVQDRLAAADREAPADAMQRLERSCQSCHQKYRN